MANVLYIGINTLKMSSLGKLPIMKIKNSRFLKSAPHPKTHTIHKASYPEQEPTKKYLYM